MCDVIEVIVKKYEKNIVRKKYLATRALVIVLLLFFRPDYVLIAFQ